METNITGALAEHLAEVSGELGAIGFVVIFVHSEGHVVTGSGAQTSMAALALPSACLVAHKDLQAKMLSRLRESEPGSLSPAAPPPAPAKQDARHECKVCHARCSLGELVHSKACYSILIEGGGSEACGCEMPAVSSPHRCVQCGAECSDGFVTHALHCRVRLHATSLGKEACGCRGSKPDDR